MMMIIYIRYRTNITILWISFVCECFSREFEATMRSFWIFNFFEIFVIEVTLVA
jgi:hypothetical protein